MPNKPLPLDEFCWPPHGEAQAGPIGYGPDGSIMVGSNYGDTGFDLNVEGDNLNIQQNNYNDSIIQNFEIVRESLNNSINFQNDNSTNIGPVTSVFDVNENIIQNVTNMGDVDMGDIVTNTDIDMRDFSTHNEGPGGGPPGAAMLPQFQPSVCVGLTKSPISAASSGNAFVPGAGIVSLLYRMPARPGSPEANNAYADCLRKASNLEQRMGRNHPQVIAEWNKCNHANPHGSGNVIGASATSYEEPQGGLNNIDPLMTFGRGNQAQNIAQGGGSVLGEADANDPLVIAQQIIQTAFNISPCTIEANKMVLVSRETKDRYWIIAEACDECPP